MVPVVPTPKVGLCVVVLKWFLVTVVLHKKEVCLVFVGTINSFYDAERVNSNTGLKLMIKLPKFHSLPSE